MIKKARKPKPQPMTKEELDKIHIEISNEVNDECWKEKSISFENYIEIKNNIRKRAGMSYSNSVWLLKRMTEVK